MQTEKAFEDWLVPGAAKKKQAVVNSFNSWGRPDSITRDFSQSLIVGRGQAYQIWDHQSVPMLTWAPEPMAGDPVTTFFPRRVANGQFDSYVLAYGAALKLFLAGPNAQFGDFDDRRAYLRFAHEANQDVKAWQPAAAGWTADRARYYREMWQHVHDLLVKPLNQGGLGITNSRLAWVWNVSAQDQSGAQAELLYPGDAYVDWTSIDGYSNGIYRAPATVFGSMLSRIRTMAPSKPVAIAEFGSNIGAAEKSQWFTDYFAWLQNQDPIRMTVIFNSDHENNGDWLGSFGPSWIEPPSQYVETFAGVYRGFITYRTGAVASWLLSPDTSKPRLMSDPTFLGQ